MKKGLLVWWSTNTRAASVILHVALRQNIPVTLVLDPNSNPPSKNNLDKTFLIYRNQKPLKISEIQKLIRNSINELQIEKMVLLPTSEYVLDFVFKNKTILDNLDIPFGGTLEYEFISSKESIYFLNEFGYYGEVAKKLPQISNPPYVAKPKKNIYNGKNLKPFIISNIHEQKKLLTQSEVYFAQELCYGDSVYWCGYRNSQGEIKSYFQENIAQVLGGGSVGMARYQNKDENQALDMIMRNFLNSICYRGPLMAEFRGNPLKLIEINPRFWGPILLDATNGGQILKSFFKDYFGIDADVETLFKRNRKYFVPKLLNELVTVQNSFIKTSTIKKDLEDQFSQFASKEIFEIGGDW